MTTTRRRISPEPIPARVWGIAAVTGAGAFMAMLDSTVANLALETLRGDFASTLPAVQWVTTGYLIALAVSLPAAGWLGIRHGPGRIWAASLAAFVGASTICAVAPSVPALLGGRVLQGLAAGLMVPTGQAVIAAAAGPAQLGRLFGVLGLAVALGPALGPAAGGLLLEVASWRWLFIINVPIGIAALIAARGLVTTGTSRAARAPDPLGFGLLALGLPLLLYGATKASADALTALPVVAVAVGIALVAAFIASALRRGSALVDLRLLRRPAFAAATAATGLTGANMFAGLLLVPLYLQLAAGFDTGATGLMLLAMGLGSAVALPVAGSITDRFGAAPVTLAGAALLLVTTLPFLLAGHLPAWVLTLVLVTRGVGLAWAQMPPTTAAYASVSRAQIADATTLVNIVQRVGGALGATGVVIVLDRAGGSANSGAYAWAFGCLALIAALTLVCAHILARGDAAGRGPGQPTFTSR
jgi:EmrB/QacA subfamily drug resistance transporter